MKTSRSLAVLVLIAAHQSSASVQRDKAYPLPAVSESLSTLDHADKLVRAAQEQFWQLFPPSDDWLYIHPDHTVRPVIWSTGWPDAFKRQMYAEMKIINGNLYPVYTIWAKADRITGDLTYYNMYGQPVWVSPAPTGYTPLSPVLDRYGVESIEELSEQQQKFTASSVGLEFQLLPGAFVESYQEDVILERQMATLFAEPTAMTMSAPPPPGEGDGSSNITYTGTSIGQSYPEGALLILPNLTGTHEQDWLGLTNTVAGTEYEFYFTYNLKYIPFTIEESTYDMARLAKGGLWASGDSLFWDAPIVGENGLNQSVGYFRAYSVVDSDGDGLSDAYEVMMTETSPTNVFSGGSVLADGEKDQDGDGLTNLEEYQGMANGVYTDPLVKDSDNDDVDDDVDPWPMDGAGAVDTDRDRMPDDLYNNRTSTSYPMLIADSDDDNDLFTDDQETLMGSDWKDASSPGANAYLDTDGDGLYDWQEISLGTYTNYFDSDNDLIGDGYEVNVLSNSPLDPDSYNAQQIDDYRLAAEDADSDGRPAWAERRDATNPGDRLDYKAMTF